MKVSKDNFVKRWAKEHEGYDTQKAIIDEFYDDYKTSTYSINKYFLVIGE